MGDSLFGTDGVRGIANIEIDPELAYRLCLSAGRWFMSQDACADEDRRSVVLGRDPRRSGDMLTASAVAALTSLGLDAVVMGVVPTPAVAHAVVNSEAVVGGVVISASHNPAEYNGIKLFDAVGHKLTQEDERIIESGVHQGSPEGWQPPSGQGIGRRVDGGQQVSSYLDHLCESTGMGPQSLRGMRVLLDCANGAAGRIGPAALRQVGASVEAVFTSGDGDDINACCGSTHPEALRGRMLSEDFDFGLALDGDADRAIAVSPSGRLLDGDDLLFILAVYLHETGRLPGGKIVTTVINNRGLDASLRPLGIEVVHCPVGDRQIMIAMQEEGIGLGGEISGHIILGHCATCGDGLLTGLLVGDILAQSGSSLDELLDGLEKYPQVKKNVAVERKGEFADDEVIERSIREAEAELGQRGRLIVRPSGTEPVVRVMVEGPDYEQILSLADQLQEVIEKRLN